MTRRNYPFDDLVTAIQHEMSAILADNGSDGEKIALRDGSLLGTHDAGYDYVSQSGTGEPHERQVQARRIMATARRERPLAQPRYRSEAGRRNESPQQVGPGDVVDGRLYLAVPFEEKDEAKRLVSARWDRERRLWYVTSTTSPAQVARWLR